MPAVPSLQHYDGTIVRTLVDEGVDCPNDCVVGPDGRFWFTDPRGQALVDDSLPGRLCCYEPSTHEIVVQADGLQYPNGLGFSTNGESTTTMPPSTSPSTRPCARRRSLPPPQASPS
jgi:gluconolactonase